MPLAIKVENLSKSLGHNSAQTGRNTALRDVLARSTKNLVRNSAASPVKSMPTTCA